MSSNWIETVASHLDTPPHNLARGGLALTGDRWRPENVEVARLWANLPGPMAKPPAPPRAPGAESRAKLASLSDVDRASVQELAQVEQAIASLEGRNADMALDVALARRDRVRIQKELETVAEQGTLRLAAADRRRRVLLVVAGLGGLVVLAGLGKGVLMVGEWMDVATSGREASKRASVPFVEAGFEPVASSIGGVLVQPGERGRCFVAVAASPAGPQPVRAERGSEKAEGQGSVGWCACGAGDVSVSSTGPAGTGLAILAVPAGRVGGADLLGRVEPAPGAILGETDDRACVEEAIDELVGATPPAPSPAAMPEVATRLASLGFTAVAGAPPEAAFLAMPAEAQTCFVVVAAGADAELLLRLPGGERIPAPEGVLGFCQGQPARASAWRKHPVGLAIVSAPLADVGGTVGLREALARAGQPDAPILRTADVLAADTRAIVLSSGASPAHLIEGGSSLLGKVDPPFLFGFSVSEPAAAPRLEGGPDPIACSPPLGPTTTSALCLGSARAFEGKAGVLAQRPEWLRVGTDQRSLENGLALMALARRLALSEFELTTVGGVTDTPTGAEVVGRAGEAEIVGVTLGGTPPAIHTLSDGSPWELSGEPHVVALSPGQRVTLTASPPLAPAPWAPPGTRTERRVTVLFRR